MDLKWCEQIIDEAIESEESEMSETQKIYAKYMLEMNKLKRLARTKDYSPAGEARFEKQFNRVKAAQELLVRHESRLPVVWS